MAASPAGATADPPSLAGTRGPVPPRPRERRAHAAAGPGSAAPAPTADPRGQANAGFGNPVWTYGSAAPATSWVPAPEPRTVVRPAPRRDPAESAAAIRTLRRGMSVIAACAVVGGGLAWSAVAVSEQAQSVQGLQQRLAGVLDANQRLTEQLAALDSPSRIESLAVDRLGLQRPAAYVPVPLVPVQPAVVAPGKASAVVVHLPAPPGPLPGSPAALMRGARALVSGLWRRVVG